MLAALQVTLKHDTGDTDFARSDLSSNVGGNLGLVEVVLRGVAVRAVDHDGSKGVRVLGTHGGKGFLHVLSSIVRATSATSQDDMTVPVAGSPDDTGHALRVDTHETVRVGGGLHGVDGNTD